LTGDGWRETVSQDRHDHAAAGADTGRPQGRPMSSRGPRGGGWGPRLPRGSSRQQCELTVTFAQFIDDCLLTYSCTALDVGRVTGTAYTL